MKSNRQPWPMGGTSGWPDVFENFSCILGRGKSARKWSKMLGCVAQISSCMSGLNYVLTINSVSVSGLKYQISLLATNKLKKKKLVDFLMHRNLHAADRNTHFLAISPWARLIRASAGRVGRVANRQARLEKSDCACERAVGGRFTTLRLWTPIKEGILSIPELSRSVRGFVIV